MSKKVRHIFGLLVLVAMLSACSKDTELYTPINQEQERTRPPVQSIKIKSDNSGDTEPNNGGSKGVVPSASNANSQSSAGSISSGVFSPINSGAISISDDDDDEDDDN